MSVVPWPNGVPGERLGIAHTVKHWLDPREMWEDVAEPADDDARPRHVLRTLDVPHPWEQAYSPSPILASRWSELGVIYRTGYLTVLLDSLARHAELPERWARIAAGRRAAATTDGIYVEVRPARDGRWQLYTAYRPADFKLVNPECPPRDPTSVQLRRGIATLQARRKLARKTLHEDA